MRISTGVLLALTTHLVSVEAFGVHKTTAFRTTTSRSNQESSTTALGASAGSIGCRMIGIGSATPATILTNADLESVVETSDDWIRSRTGIAQRHVLLEHEKIRDLEIKASLAAMEMAGVKPEDLDVVIVASSTPDDLFGDAPSLATALGCSTNTFAFDLTAACSGFLFAMLTAGKFLEAPNGLKKKALIVGADALSRWVDWDDRNSCILFGDGAGAAIMETSDSPGLLGFSAHSNGASYLDLKCAYKGTPRYIATPGDGTTVSSAQFGKLEMNGKEVYKFATREVPRVLEEALEASGMTVADIDWLVLHQANIRIMEIVADRLGIPMEKVITNLADYGNTSAASIPIALDEAVRSGKIKKGDVLACAGFGAGLSWGATILKWG